MLKNLMLVATRKASLFFFKNLLESINEKYKQKVVILIDEYDKPLLDNIANLQMAEEAREQLKAFYGVIKDSDKYIRFVFLTGVSKFSKVSLFSGLNNFEDITLNPDFGNICGYTQNDVETTFSSLLEGVNLEELKLWYNGYNFLKEKVYNPFDILLFIRGKHVYKNYWFETGTPSFLIKLIKEQDYYLPNLVNMKIGEELLNSFDIKKINIEILLQQAGYLTIQDVLQNPIGGLLYSLVVPNKEVRLSLNASILDMFVDNPTFRIKSQMNAFYALRDANLEEFRNVLHVLFASLPYQNYANNKINIYEGFYASVIYVYLASLGFPVYTEESTNRGRLDMNLEINDIIYIFEFKMEKPTASTNALQQIKDKKYYEKFLNQTTAERNKTIWLVGIHFNEQEKNISVFEWEKMS